MPGTRKDILREVEDWLEDRKPETPNIVWILGAPGAGKTEVSSSIVRRHRCVDFFAKRGISDRNNPRVIWRNIAFELTKKFPDVRREILNVLESNAGNFYPNRASVKDQFRELIDGPLGRHFPSTSTDTLLIVIDALDECFDPRDSKISIDWDGFMETLVEWRKLSSACKLIVASRNEGDIDKNLNGVGKVIELYSGGKVSTDSSDDIRVFFETKFSALHIQTQRPTEADIDRLSKHAAGLFQWATVVADYVLQRGGNQSDRLNDMLSMTDGGWGVSDEVKSRVRLDVLYAQVLVKRMEILSPPERDSVSLVLASLIFVASDCLVLEDLKVLLEAKDNESKESIENAINNLKPLVNVEPGKPLGLSHKSIRDFLEDEERVRAAVDTFLARDRTSKADSSERKHPACFSLLLEYTRSSQHALILRACMNLMDKKLRFNIHRIPTSHPDTFNFRSENHVPPPDSLLFACHF